MNKKLSILVVTLLLSLVSSGMAQATYYHFEDYRWDDVKYIGTGATNSWSFDLDLDQMSLWAISSIPLQSGGLSWDPALATTGSMDENDILHRAYLTMQFCNVKDDTINLLFEDVLNTTYTDVQKCNLGGINIDVFTQLYNDHFLKVTITSVSGDFIVDWMTLAGCYETGPVPVPEPGSLALLGVGLVALLAVVSRRKL